MNVFAKTSLVLLACSMLSVASFAEAPTAPATQPTTATSEVPQISLEQFDALRSQPMQIVLDVRTPREYADGHVPGAINVPMGKAFDQAIASQDKSKAYLVYCHSGKRSFLASKRMHELGFNNLLNFRGGIVAWEEAGKPMVKGTEPGAEPTTKPEK
ncbi:MAG: rhodanese-like domain-containing protein [Tepidisphaeraceae bacterium]